jgi:hypothetical protein
LSKLTKGTKCYAAGKLSVSQWESADGTPRHGLQLLVWTVVPMGTIGRRRPPQQELRVAVAAGQAASPRGYVMTPKAARASSERS